VTTTDAFERRLSLAIIVAATAIFGGLLLVVPFYFPTFDEAKYLGIGVNIWAGHGITTVFGVPFLSHAPAWPAIVGWPQATFGVDALAVGRLLDAIAGTSFVALTGWLGWRVRPVVGAISAAGLLTLVYLHDLTRTARLDVPAAALLLLYLCVGFLAFRRGSMRLAVVAGAVFALGFLVKEIDLPFAPVPAFAAILWGRSWRSIGRTGGALLAVGSLGVAPWFVYYAANEHTVYRLGTQPWTLVPLGLGIGLLVVIGLMSDGLAGGRIGRWLELRVGPAERSARWRFVVAWGLTLAWSALLLFVFARTDRLTGTTFLGISQLQLYAATWFDTLRAVALFGGAGVVLAVVALRGRPDSPWVRGISDLFMATICGIPLVLLVISVGEPPRNYLANIALIVVLAAAGWVRATEWLLAETRQRGVLVVGAAILGAAGGLVLAALVNGSPVFIATGTGIVGALAGATVQMVDRADRPVRGLVVPALACVVLVGGAGVLGIHGRNTLQPAGGTARSLAVTTEDAWIKANVPPGTVVAYGSFLGYEAAYPIAGSYRAIQVPARLSVSSPSAPDGISWNGQKTPDDWVAVDIAPRNVGQFEGLRAAWIKTAFLESGAQYWVYSTGIDTSSPSIEAALTTAVGFTKVAEWTFPVAGTSPLHGAVYRVDASQIAFNAQRIVFAPAALARLVGLLAADGPAGKAAAQRLLSEADAQPAGPDADAAMSALRALAGQ
jgi:hypothetical protein